MKENFKSNIIEKTLIFSIALSSLLSLGPYFIWGNSLLIKIPLLFSMALFLLVFLKDKISTKNILIFFLYILLLMFLSLPLDESGSLLSSLTLITAVFLLLNNQQKNKVSNLFYKLFAFSLIPGIGYWVMNILGLEMPWEYLQSEHQGKDSLGYFYKKYLGAVVLTKDYFSSPSFGSIYRFSAMYDEPGVVGTLAALLLIMKRFRLNDIYSKVLLIAGIISFSFAFYLLIAIYLMLTRPIKGFVILISVTILLVAFKDDLSNNHIVNSYIYNRFGAITEDVSKVDNRSSSCFEAHYKEFLEGENILLGMGVSSSSDSAIGCGQSHIKQVFYEHGVLGIFFISLFFTIMIYMYTGASTKKALYPYTVFILILTLSLYQRPNLFSLWFMVLLIGGLLDIKYVKSNKSLDLSS